jgi:hypothetical protein
MSLASWPAALPRDLVDMKGFEPFYLDSNYGSRAQYTTIKRMFRTIQPKVNYSLDLRPIRDLNPILQSDSLEG